MSGCHSVVVPYVQCSNDSMKKSSNDSQKAETIDNEVDIVSPNKYVKLNVGGSLHYTTMGTLTKEDNMLRAMFSGRMVVLSDKEGWVLIDRCGKHFSTILNYLRDGSVTLTDSRSEISELLAEAKYYLIQGLKTMKNPTI